MPAALLIGSTLGCDKEWRELSSLADLTVFSGTTREEFVAELKAGKYDDVVAMYRSNASISLTGPFNEDIIKLLPASLKFICHRGAGYDDIDIETCLARGLLVSHTPEQVRKATADITLFLILGALRRIHIPIMTLRAGTWRGPSPQAGHDPSGKVLGILGMGGIGREVAIRARSIGMVIQYHNRKRLTPELEDGAKYVSKDELLKTSDVISLNLNLEKSSIHIIGKEEFKLMKDGVIIVNTGRGKLIDEQALVDSLESGKVFSAGLDVFENEPKIHPGLLTNENVVLLPHIGTATVECHRDMSLQVIANVRSALETGTLLNPVAECMSAMQKSN